MLKVSKGRLTSVLSIGKEEGFTLIELMVAAALSLVVMGGIYSVYQSQSKSYIVREQVTAMQQNLRAGMVVMTSDIRMAGYVYPGVTLTGGVNAGILEANQNDIKFRLLKDKNNPPTSPYDPEAIKYSLLDKDGDGDPDLVKEVDDSGVTQLVAENIDALDFVYLNSEDNPIPFPIPDQATTTDPALIIKSIQVTMVAKTGRSDPGYKNTNSYKNQQNTEILPAKNDGFRRRVLSREIKCRNL